MLFDFITKWCNIHKGVEYHSFNLSEPTIVGLLLKLLTSDTVYQWICGHFIGSIITIDTFSCTMPAEKKVNSSLLLVKRLCLYTGFDSLLVVKYWHFPGILLWRHGRLLMVVMLWHQKSHIKLNKPGSIKLCKYPMKKLAHEHSECTLWWMFYTTKRAIYDWLSAVSKILSPEKEPQLHRNARRVSQRAVCKYSTSVSSVFRVEQPCLAKRSCL